MTRNEVTALFVAPRARAAMEPRAVVFAEEGKGLVGDRYHEGTGSMSRFGGAHREVSLIEAEALQAVEAALGSVLEPGIHRRNIVVRGASLESWIGGRFLIGEAVFRGVQRCAPCGYLEKLSGLSGIREALKGRGGLRAEVLVPGTIRVGDSLALDSPTSHGERFDGDLP
ncbi:MAG: MOSC domain-containing protein [Myxococcota bacterium]